MVISRTDLQEVMLLEPTTHRDDRGWFREVWNEARYQEAGISVPFVQDNVSHSRRNVLRGLHSQYPHAQAKLVSVLEGSVFDVAVDIRNGSPTFGVWTGHELSARNGRQLYIPVGFAHGFVVLSDTATLSYKCSDYYNPGTELSVIWDDPDIGIRWPVDTPLLSGRDAAAPRLRDIAPGMLPPLPRS